LKNNGRTSVSVFTNNWKKQGYHSKPVGFMKDFQIQEKTQKPNHHPS
jgi:hypothetical protein